ncbi:MAG: hypothetical protein EBZ47_02330 [Chlamydiae bacterium]|nr:hypothetical protein [Chlamydiota bacterium]
MWKQVFKHFCRAMVDFVFPTNCFCCHEEKVTHFLCQSCVDQLVLADIYMQEGPQSLLSSKKAFIHNHLKPEMIYSGYAFEPVGPAVSLVKHLSLGNKVQKTIGSFVLLQIHRLSWPFPDLIIPIPDPGNYPFGVAKQLSFFHKSQIKKKIRKKNFILTPEGLERKDHYCLSKKFTVSGLSILILSIHPLPQEEIYHLGQSLVDRGAKNVCFFSVLSN